MPPKASTSPARRAVRLIATELSGTPDPAHGVIRSPEDSGRMFAAFIGSKDREHFAVIHLSARNVVIGMEIASIGDQSSALVHPREAFKAAILMNASTVIFGHNHPSGDLTPSPEDRSIHSSLSAAGDLLGIPVVDFVIVAGDRWHSFHIGGQGVSRV